MKRLNGLIGLLSVVLVPALVRGQGFIVPPERVPFTGAYAIQAITGDVTIKDQVAEVQLSQTFRNTSSVAMEVQYVFPVPPDAVINKFTLMVDGRELPARLYSREEARRIYEGIVRTKRDPALLEYIGYGMLQTNVFPLPAHGERKVTMRYSQVCRRDREVTEFLLPLGSGKLSSKPVQELRVTARIESAGRIKSVYSPTYAASVERPTDHSAIVRFEERQTPLADDLRVMWSLSEQPVGATVISYKPDGEDGYFLLLASPEVKAEHKVVSKTVVFALDRSGSMSGQKIEQAKNALKFVMNNLREGDTFNIIVYDDRVESFKPELQRFNEEARREAQRFIDGIHDGGSTNIDGALKRALGMAGDTGRPTYVIFLTDGLPTEGEKNEMAIAANAKNANRAGARLFAFGVGFDVNARLLDRLATDNSGTSEYVRPNQDIESAVAKFYSRMTAPVLTDIEVELAGADVNRLYPRDLPDLFAGGQIVAVGRYRSGGDTRIRLTGRVGDQKNAFVFPAALARHSNDETYAFVEKLWATRRVGEILNDLDLKGRNQELIDELVRLSTKHGILTPYTAFLADERTDLHAWRLNSGRASRAAFDDEATSMAQNTTGASGVNLRGGKQDLQRQGGGYGGGGGYSNAGAQRYKDVSGKEQVVDAVQVVGNKAMYRRENRWVDPAVTPEETRKAEQVEQFSDRYFELARSNAKLRQYLALPDGCLIKVDGKVYQVNARSERGG